MKRITIFCIVAILAPAACNSASTTALHLSVSYDSTWQLSNLDVIAQDLTRSVDVQSDVTVLVPDNWAGLPITIDVWGSRDDTRFAHGQVVLTPTLNKTVDGSVVMARIPCGEWCNAGDTECIGNGTATCEVDATTGCMEWTAPVDCAGANPYCAFGTCLAACVDECNLGDTRCTGPGAVEMCGTSTVSTCHVWQPEVECPATDTCSNGSCAATCHDECTAGAVECFGTGTITCGDLNGDGCLEWGPLVECGNGTSCSNGTCSATCTDECSTNSCDGETFTACGQFDLDPCLDKSPGVSCVPADPCMEGSCSATSGCSATPVVCDTPPAATCADANTLRTFSSSGTCSTGTCDYPSTDTTCANGCANGACTGVTPACTTSPNSCTTPPPTTCTDANTLRTYASTGTCSNDTCSYASTDTTCANGCVDDVCSTSATKQWLAVSANGQPVNTDEDFTCAIRAADNTIKCWGYNGDSESSPPTGAFSSLNAGNGFACAIKKSDDSISCWGDSSDGETAAPSGAFSSLSLGDDFGCAVQQSDSSLLCWGNGGPDPTTTPPTGSYSSVASDLFSSCAISAADGSIKCWGITSSIFSFSAPPYALVVDGVSYAGSTIAENFCAISGADGSISCSGNAPTVDRTPPAGAFSTVAIGNNEACAIKSSDGSIHCWGSAHTSFGSPPTGSFSSVSVGYSHACAIKTSDGSIVCWGSNTNGESTVPTP